MKKKWLKGCVISLLAAGVVSVGGIIHAEEAEVIDMTLTKDVDSMTPGPHFLKRKTIYIYPHQTDRPSDPNQGLKVVGQRVFYEGVDNYAWVSFIARTDNS